MNTDFLPIDLLENLSTLSQNLLGMASLGIDSRLETHEILQELDLFLFEFSL